MGILILIKAIIRGFDMRFPSGDWNFLFMTIQGILFIIMGVGNIIVKKYFIEWDDNEIRFLLPDTKKLETIKIDNINSVSIRLFEIELQLKDNTRILDLSNLEFEDIKKIKEKFEIIKRLKNS
ncbi:MAG: hypothetical protein GYA12_03000 [Chloroflexi bacterium]|nr:hypothetical protein [Chloroflexota bacterium]